MPRVWMDGFESYVEPPKRLVTFKDSELLRLWVQGKSMVYRGCRNCYVRVDEPHVKDCQEGL